MDSRDVHQRGSGRVPRGAYNSGLLTCAEVCLTNACRAGLFKLLCCEGLRASSVCVCVCVLHACYETVFVCSEMGVVTPCTEHYCSCFIWCRTFRSFV